MKPKLSHDDTYENRVLFIAMYHGAPGYKTKEMFPEWERKLSSLKVGSVEEAIWKSHFLSEALEMREG